MNDPRAEFAPSTVIVTTPARLHMGFLDPGASLGREFGSIGVALNEMVTRIRLTRSALALTTGHLGNSRVADIVSRCCRTFGFPLNVAFDLEQSIPEHIGLGSGTQLALAIGVGLHRLFGSERSVREIASAIGRGKRSGIGIAVFEQGGFVVDGGRGPSTATPPPLARFQIPDRWRFILAFDSRGKGLHGDRELAAFRALPPFPAREAARICHILLLRGLPALAEADLTAFGDVVTDIQRSVGDYFAPAQGGRFTSPDVADCLNWLHQQGAHGIGQTSWGPTGFCLAASPEEAQQLVGAVQQRFAATGHLSWLVASACNTGASLRCTGPAETDAVPAGHASSALPTPEAKPCRPDPAS